jgi:hypothetical protein
MKQQRSVWLWFCLGSLIVAFTAIFQDQIGLSLSTGPMLRVFGSFWASGWAADHGLNPFATYRLTAPSALPGLFDVNLSPPALLPYFALLSRVDPLSAAHAWILLQAGLFVAGTSILIAEARAPLRPWYVLWMLLAAEIHDGIWLGQDYAELYLLAILGWVCLQEGRDVTAGLLIGALVAAKPNLGLWPVFLLLIGNYRPALVAMACALGLSLVPGAIYGPSVYSEWIAAVASDRHFLFPTHASLPGFAARLGVPHLGSILSVALIAGASFLVWRVRPSVPRAGAIALAVGLLASPLSWADYMIFLLPAFADGLWGKLRVPAALLLTVPPIVLLACMRFGPWGTAAGSLIYTAAFMLILGGVTAPLLSVRSLIRDEA